MEYLDQDFPDTNKTAETIQTTRPMRQSWFTISRWSIFFAIVGFVFIGLLLLGLGQISQLLPMMSYALGENPILDAIAAMGAFFIAIVVLLLAIQFLIHFWQYRFGTLMKRAVTFTDQNSFEQAWLNYRNVFRTVGIITALSLILMIGLIMFAYSMTR